MNRRSWLATIPAGLAAGTLRAGYGEGTALVASDHGTLRRVLVHEPGREARLAVSIVRGDHPLEAVDLLGSDAAGQHQSLAARLAAAGAEVVTFRGLLDAALARAREEDTLDDWLAETFPHLTGAGERVGVDALIGADPEVVFPPPAEPDRRPLPGAVPLKFLCYVRDLACQTPRGLVVANLTPLTRAPEAALFRFLLRWAPPLAGVPVAFDAAAEGIELQGGDLVVLDEKTLLVGVGNLTEPWVAPRLARRLGMDVVAVRLPGPSRRRPSGGVPPVSLSLRTTFLHLDSVVSLVGPDLAVALPYFLERGHAGADPMLQLVRGMEQAGYLEREAVAEAERQLRAVGSIRVHRAGSGEDSGRGGEKLVDYLRRRGFTVVPVGGEPDGPDLVAHLVESVLREARFQAANVVAIGPRRVVAVAGNGRTLAAMRKAGVEVEEVVATDLVRWHGGPHCLTLPLAREG